MKNLHAIVFIARRHTSVVVCLSQVFYTETAKHRSRKQRHKMPRDYSFLTTKTSAKLRLGHPHRLAKCRWG